MVAAEDYQVLNRVVLEMIKQMTLEEDSISVVQMVFMVTGPILLFRTVDLWRGILAGGIAKAQAWIVFSTDPLTIISVVACAGTLLYFWTIAYMFGWFERVSNQESGMD
jgi:hypothetical protein